MAKNFSDFNYSKALDPPRRGSPTKNGPDMGKNGIDIVNNLKGINNYAMVLVRQDDSMGRKRVQKTPGKLGNQYFINTNIECNDGNNKYIFISNRDTESAMGGNRQSTGLLSSINSSIDHINPEKFFNAIFNKSSGECAKVELKTFKQLPSGRTIEDTEIQYMGTEDLCDLKEYYFADKNAYTDIQKNYCGKEKFSNMKNSYYEENYFTMSDDEVTQIYLTTVTLLGLYITLKFIYKI